ncbi:hypothetical protein [Pseudoalteromonas rubra]|uniref:hypothetical protein n=1 Tax=Pseudoalteromonas rubra TaxID=43658 RepID=UPI00026CBA83|nr:hypothetical protein [Pseudoalteromonas rubra]
MVLWVLSDSIIARRFVGLHSNIVDETQLLALYLLGEVSVKKLIFIILAWYPFSTLALEESSLSYINLMQVYPDYGGGDFIFTVDTPAPKCKGYWISKNSPAYDVASSMALAAYHANTKVIVFGHEEPSAKWAGSTTHFCKIYTIVYKK